MTDTWEVDVCDICNGMTEEEVRRQTLQRIAEHDYTMIGVEPERRGRITSPGFVYSIGLWHFRRAPEIIVVGAPVRHAAEMVEKYAELVKAGRTFTAGEWSDEFVPGYQFMFEQVDRRHYQQWFVRAFDFYSAGDFPALQLLWPDRKGIWPWQSVFGRVNREPQPLLTASGRPESFSPWQ